MTRRTRVYIAGPMTGSGNPYVNIHDGLQTAAVLIDRGYAPYIPHLTCFLEACIGGRDHRVWLDFDRAWLSTCDALLRRPGRSPGADQEERWAREMGIPIFYSLDSLFADVRTGPTQDDIPNRKP